MNIQPIVVYNQQLIYAKTPDRLQPMVVNSNQSKKDFAARLDKALTYSGIPADRSRIARVSKMFEVSREAVRKWLAGESIPDTKRISDISRQTGVRGEWLLTGQGPMRHGESYAEESDYKEIIPPHILRIAYLIAQAPPEKLNAILTLLDAKEELRHTKEELPKPEQTAAPAPPPTAEPAGKGAGAFMRSTLSAVEEGIEAGGIGPGTDEAKKKPKRGGDGSEE